MSLLTLNSSHVGSLPGSIQHTAATKQSNDDRSRASSRSTTTINYKPGRKVSAASVESTSSRQTGILRVVNQNVASNRSTSYVGLDRPKSKENTPRSISLLEVRTQASSRESAKSQCTASKADSSLLVNEGTFQDIELHSSDENAEKVISSGNLDSYHIVGSGQERHVGTGHSISPKARSRCTTSGSEAETNHHRFKKLMDNLRPRHARSRRQLTARKDRWSLDDFEQDTPTTFFNTKPKILGFHRKAYSWSSGGASTPAKSANDLHDQCHTMQHSENGHKLRIFMRSSRNSRKSDSNNHSSLDDGNHANHLVNESAHIRAIQRRQILEELHDSEEGYIKDLKVLNYVYITILASVPQFPSGLQAEIERNIGDILLLHEEIFVHMKLFLREPPSSDRPQEHHRSKSIDSDSKESSALKKAHRKSRRSFESMWSRQFKPQIKTSTPREAADMARVLGGMLPRFFVYEEYGARYQTILDIVAVTSKSIPNWNALERGMEALMNSLLPKKDVEEGKRRGLTLEDMLIKPIQRVCRYPLLLLELLKNTLSLDDLDSETAVQKVYNRMCRIAEQINSVTNNPDARAKIELTWQLQSLIQFPGSATAPTTVRPYGHIRLCGLLYVVHRSHPIGEPRGDHMLCVLFDAHLLLATPSQDGKGFELYAIIGSQLQIERCDDGYGLQCFNAVHCWKLLFTYHSYVHELILCATSAVEEHQWKGHIEGVARPENAANVLADLIFLDHRMFPIGVCTASPGNAAWRVGIQNELRAKKVNTKLVNIKSVSQSRDASDSPASNVSSSFRRSNPPKMAGRILSFAPERSDRARLAQVLDGIWTKELLPFPESTMQRSGNFIRASKNTVIRKLSKASTTTQSSKRTISHKSLDDPFLECQTDEAHIITHDARPSSTSRVRAKTFCMPPEVDNLPDGRAARSVIFESARKNAKPETAPTTHMDTNDGIEAASKAKKPMALLKALSSEGIKKRLK